MGKNPIELLRLGKKVVKTAEVLFSHFEAVRNDLAPIWGWKIEEIETK